MTLVSFYVLCYVLSIGMLFLLNCYSFDDGFTGLVARTVILNIYIQEECKDICIVSNVTLALNSLNTLMHILLHSNINILNGRKIHKLVE